MKKNLMNAALLGLLIATPACSFVSCKDYDEDFKKVNGRLDALAADTKKQLDTEIASLTKQLAEANVQANNLKQQLGLKANQSDLTKLTETSASKEALQTAQKNLEEAIANAKKENSAALVKALDDLKVALEKSDKAAVAEATNQLKLLVATKADKTALDNALVELGKLQTSLAGKADKTALDGKADKSELATVNGLIKDLQSKADSYALKSDLKDKATTQFVTEKVNELQGKLATMAAFEGRIAALEGAKGNLATLESTVSKEEYQKKVEKINADIKSATDAVELLKNDVAGVKATADAAAKATELTAALETQKTANKSFEEKIASLEADKASNAKVAEAVNAAVTTAKAEIQGKLDKANEAIEAVKSDLQGKIDGNTNKLAEIEEALYGNGKEGDQKVAGIVETIQEVNEKLYALVRQQLSSLSVVPTTYVDGIQSFVNSRYTFNALTLPAVDAKGLVEGTDATEADEAENVNYAVALFQVNPTFANVSTDVRNYAFNMIGGVNLATRTETEAPVKPVAVKRNDKGLLAVTFKSDAPELRDGFQQIALSYTAPAKQGQTARVVMSNYARLFNAKYTDLALGVHEDDAMYATKAAEARELTTVAYNKELDLSDEVAAYGFLNGDHSTPVAIDDDSNFKGAGFTFEYALVKGEGAEAFTIDKNTGVLTPVQGEKNKYANVGKSATVRVTLKNGDKVAAVGFFKVKIALPVEVLAELTANNEVTYDCEGTALPEVTFSKFEALTDHLAKAYEYNKVNVWRNSNAPTEVSNSNYAFEFETLADGSLQQYNVDPGKTATKIPETEAKGKITVDYVHQVLKVSGLKRNEVTTDKPYVTYLRVSKKDDSKQQLFVKVTWTPSKVEAAPTTKFEATEIPETWFPSSTAGEKELRVHVQLSDKTFSMDLLSAYKNNTVKFTPVNGIDAAAAKWVLVQPNTTTVVGADGTKYDLKVEGDDKLQATVHPKNAQSTWTDVVVLEGSVVKYQSNDIAKNILHKWGASELGKGQTFTARVAYQAKYSCAPNKVAVTHAFDVRFVRPLNAKDVHSATFVDGKKREDFSNVNIKNMLSDFRGHQAQNNDREDFYTLYGLTSVTIPVAGEWKTSLGNNSKLSEVNKDNKLFELAFMNGNNVIAPTADGYSFNNLNDLRLKYVTKDAVIKDFTVTIPVTFNYAWGKVTANIIVPVTKTATPAANARRK